MNLHDPQFVNMLYLLAAALFIRQRDFFAPAFCLTWLASNLFYVAWYLSDASTMAVPLLSVGGGEAYHDWNTILDILGRGMSDAGKRDWLEAPNVHLRWARPVDRLADGDFDAVRAAAPSPAASRRHAPADLPTR